MLFIVFLLANALEVKYTLRKLGGEDFLMVNQRRE